MAEVRRVLLSDLQCKLQHDWIQREVLNEYIHKMTHYGKQHPAPAGCRAAEDTACERVVALPLQQQNPAGAVVSLDDLFLQEKISRLIKRVAELAKEAIEAREKTDKELLEMMRQTYK